MKTFPTLPITDKNEIRRSLANLDQYGDKVTAEKLSTLLYLAELAALTALAAMPSDVNNIFDPSVVVIVVM